MWIGFAFGSALFAGLTAVLAKIGVRNTDSTLATALRTVVVLAASWLMVFIVGSQGQLATIPAVTVWFLVLSGLATGASWLCYFRALQLGEVNRVAPVDRSSLLLTVVFAMVFLGETDHLGSRLPGLVLIAVGTWLMAAPGRSTTAANNAPTDSDGGAAGTSTAESGSAATRAAESGSAGTRTAESGSAGTRTAESAGGAEGLGWLPYALGSAVFAALTAVLGKVGISGVESNLGTAIRTAVVLVMAWVMVAVSGRRRRLAVPRRDLLFIVLSGLATGASWLCYFRALQEGPASVVVPIDKLSILFTVGFSAWVLHERLTGRAALGLALLVAGTLLMLL